MSVFDLMATGFLATGIWYGFKTFRGGGSGDMANAAMSGDTYRSAMGLDPGGVAARRATAIEHAQDRRVSRVAAQVTNLSTEMRKVEGRLERLTGIEQQEHYTKLHNYENQLKVLQELEAALMGIWSGFQALGHASNQLIRQPQLFSEHSTEIMAMVETYNKFTDKVIEIMRKLQQSYGEQLKVDKQYETLNEEYKTYFDIITELGVLNINKVKSLMEKLHGKEKIVVDAKKKHHIQIEIDELNRLKKDLDILLGPNSPINPFKRMRKADSEVWNQLQEMDKADKTTVDNVMKRFAGWSDQLRVTYRDLREDDQGRVRSSLNTLWRYAWSETGNLPMVSQELGKLRERAETKIKRLKSLNLIAAELGNERLMQNVTEKLKRIEQIVLEESQESEAASVASS